MIRNPYYLLILGCVALWVRWRAMGEALGAAGLKGLGGILGITVLLNLLLSRAGSKVLLELPVPLLGGPYTLEALLFGLAAGVQLASLLAVVMAFASVVSPVELLRAIPASFFPVGLTASVGLGFVPRARRSLERIAEARLVRGRQPGGWRDLPNLIVPMVVLSLENAMALAEGLVVKGWGARRAPGWAQALMTLGYVAILAGAITAVLLNGNLPVGAALAMAGSALLVWVKTKTPPISRYDPREWTMRDSLIAGLSLGVLLGVALIAWISPDRLGYYPYPQAHFPRLEVGLVVGLLLLAAPAGLANGDDHAGDEAGQLLVSRGG